MLGHFEDMKSRIKGFTLIELSIAITIISFLVVNAIVVTESNEAVADQGNVVENLGDVKQRLNEFAIYKGYFPCPADPYAMPGSDTYGLEAREPTCGGAELCECDQSVLFTEFTGSMAEGEAPMVVGTLPQKFLVGREGDAWGKNITYAVTVDNTTPKGFLKYAHGQLRVYKNNSNHQNPANMPTANADRITNKAAYVLLSHGPSGVGAFDPYAVNPSSPEDLSSIKRILPRVMYIGEPEEKHIMDNKYSWHNHHLYDRHGNPADDTDFGNFHTHKATFDRIFVKSLKPSRAQAGEEKSEFDDILLFGEKKDILWGRESDKNDKIKANIPDVIPGLIQWLEPENIVDVSGQANAWNDKESYITLNNETDDNLLAIAPVPFDNSFNPPHLKFGTSVIPTSIMSAPSGMDFDTGFTLYMVIRTDDINSTGGGRSILHMTETDGGAFTDFLHVKSVDGDGSLMEFSIDGISQQFPGVNSLTEFSVVGVRFKKGDDNVNFFRNDVSSTATIDTKSGFDLYCIGGEYTVPSSPVCNQDWDGNFAELLIYDNRLGAGQHNMVLGYLAEKYNIDMSNLNDDIDWCGMDGGKRSRESCSSDGQCCSKECRSMPGGSKCCIPTIADGGEWDYNETADRCTTNRDCCDQGAICNVYGWCWMPDPS